MNERKEETHETYDITSLMILIFFIVIYLIRLTKRVKASRIRFEYKQFERETIQGWCDIMKIDHPYDYNTKLDISTDKSPATLRRIYNKK